MMNERIKELVLEAGGSHYPVVGGKPLEKFAELIVRECARIADKAEPYKANDLILKHFGVDEPPVNDVDRILRTVRTRGVKS